MLLELKVSHFAIIENLHIVFGPGLNILSGETGAGKSVLLRGLGLLMGAKGSIESIRAGQDQASVEGSFDLSKRPDLEARLDELGIPVDDHLLVVRRVLSEGRSRVYLNGVLSTLSLLRDLVSPLVELGSHTAPLIELTGQHENKSLLSKSYHLDLLDQYAGALGVRQEFFGLFARWKSLGEEIERFERDSKEKAQRLDFLRYQRDEIAAAELSPGEDQAIETDLKKLKNAHKLALFVEMAEGSLDGPDYSALSALHQVVHRAQDLQSVDPTLVDKVQSFTQARTLIEDGLFELRTMIRQLDADPERLEKLEEKFSTIRKLQKKFGPDLEDILGSLTEIESEIGRLENAEDHLRGLTKEREKLGAELEKLAADLHKRREQGARLLADSVNEELKDLNMKGVVFGVHVARSREVMASGFSEVEFQIRNSPQEPPRGLARVASGGELSRILLSLKRVVGSGTQPRTYLFDEVDTGVSGPTAEKVGKKLHSIAKAQQVICVTHLPQVAACGDIHFFIHKSPQKGSVTMEVLRLGKKERIEEIARLISGQKVSKTSRAHAEVLLNQAR